MFRAFLLWFPIALCACKRLPESYPPPAQRDLKALLKAPVESMLVDMSDASAPIHFVRDIEPGAPHDVWRWTRRQPTIKILVLKTTGLKFVADLSLWPEAMKQTGPVSISYYISDQLLDRVRYDSPGQKHFEKRVDLPERQLGTETTVSAEIDKLYRAPQDGEMFGFILIRMGFEFE